MLLELKGIEVYYGKVQALKGVSLGVDEGTITTLLGANGAGKTTTLKAISGQKTLTRGEIWFEGQRIDKLASHDIVKMGIVQIPEGRHVFPFMSVMDNLLVGAYQQSDKKAISDTLEEVFTHFPILKERQNQQAGTLSGGEQQMLVTARAMMARPKCLLMDEPTLGLAPSMVREVGRIVETIQSRGISVLLVEQNARMALRLAQKGYVLEVGKVALKGDSKDLINNEHIKKTYLGG